MTTTAASAALVPLLLLCLFFVPKSLQHTQDLAASTPDGRPLPPAPDPLHRLRRTFFLPFEEDMAAMALASLDFCSLGACKRWRRCGASISHAAFIVFH